MPDKKNSAAAHDYFNLSGSAATLMAAADSYVMGSGIWDDAVEAMAAVLEEPAECEPVKS
jgi:hypothetical protein